MAENDTTSRSSSHSYGCSRGPEHLHLLPRRSSFDPFMLSFIGGLVSDAQGRTGDLFCALRPDPWVFYVCGRRIMTHGPPVTVGVARRSGARRPRSPKHVGDEHSVRRSASAVCVGAYLRPGDRRPHADGRYWLPWPRTIRRRLPFAAPPMAFETAVARSEAVSLRC